MPTENVPSEFPAAAAACDLVQPQPQQFLLRRTFAVAVRHRCPPSLHYHFPLQLPAQTGLRKAARRQPVLLISTNTVAMYWLPHAWNAHLCQPPSPGPTASHPHLTSPRHPPSQYAAQAASRPTMQLTRETRVRDTHGLGNQSPL